MAKDALYEYQYTTPNKKVVKEYLPAVQKPEGKRKYKRKAFWGKVCMLAGAIGIFSVLGSANPFSMIVKILLWGIVFGKGFQEARRAGEYLGRMERYYRYMKALESKKYLSLKELSEKVSKNIATVTKDLEFMIEKRWFLEGHLDHSSGQFMLTDYVYEQYKLLEQGEKIKELEEKEKQEIQKDPIKREVSKMLEEGNTYIREMRILNDGILGEKVSGRLEDLEEILNSIFDLVKRRPEKVSDLRRMMQYYLPMTVKVVTAYRNFENDRIQSEQVAEGKQEIEESLDKIYAAFINLRDKLLQEDILDVSTDLEVLETLMAQDGLIENGL